MRRTSLLEAARRGVTELEGSKPTLTAGETDKTGRFTVLTTEDYLEAGYEHVKEDVEVREKGLKSVQRKLNSACSLFIMIFKV